MINIHSGFTWIRFWFAVKFYSSDPLNLKEEITRYVRVRSSLTNCIIQYAANLLIVYYVIMQNLLKLMIFIMALLI